jgi:type II secretory pathway pseudopilin PulG
LIELLVTLAIITLLLAIALPALARARAAQQSAACQSNLHQIALSLLIYAQDHDGLGPDDYAPTTWDVQLIPYLPADATFLCPADASDLSEDFGCSYEWRDSFAVDPDHPETSFSSVNLLNVQQTDLILTFDALPSWHAPNQINAAALDASARTYTLADFAADLARPVH